MESKANIDAVIRLPNKERCSVEIKSWHSWQRKGFITRRKTKNQVLRQCDEMSTTYAVIWLPEARRQSLKRERVTRKNEIRYVTIIEGNVNFFINGIQKFIHWNVLVQFPSIPPGHVRELLKYKYRFRWENEHVRWFGRCDENAIVELRSLVENHNGKISILKEY